MHKSILSVTYSSTAVRSLKLSSFLILISIPTFVTPTSSSSLCSFLFQVISKYIKQCWHWYRLPVLPEYFFQQCKSSHHIPYQSVSKWILIFGDIFFYYHFSGWESLGYGSQGFFSKPLSIAI